MIVFVKGMDAVSYKQIRNLTACFGYPILLSNGLVFGGDYPNPHRCSTAAYPCRLLHVAVCCCGLFVFLPLPTRLEHNGQ